MTGSVVGVEEVTMFTETNLVTRVENSTGMRTIGAGAIGVLAKSDAVEGRAM